MADLEALRTMVRSICLQDENSVTDATLLTYFEQGYLKAAALFEWPWLQEIETPTVATPWTSTPFPTGFQSLTSIGLSGETKRLRQISTIEGLERYGDNVPTGTAETFYLWEGAFHLQPAGTADFDVVINYTKSPTLLVDDTDEPEWHENFHYLLVDFVLAQVWRREEDYVRADAHMREYDRTVNEMARFYLQRGTSQPVVWGERPDYAQRRRPHINMPWLNGV